MSALSALRLFYETIQPVVGCRIFSSKKALWPGRMLHRTTQEGE